LIIQVELTNFLHWNFIKKISLYRNLVYSSFRSDMFHCSAMVYCGS